MKFKKAVKTKDHIFYYDYDNNEAKMFDNKMKLISDNYFAEEELFEILEDKSYTWISKKMKYNALQF
jgi:hypothetical protein